MKINTSLIKNITLFFLSISFSFLISEVIIRFSYNEIKEEKIFSAGNPDAYFNPNEFYGFISTVSKMQFYSKAGYRPIPNWVENGIQNNDFGARSDLSSNKINNLENKVVVSGGSAAWGAGVKQEDLFTKYFNGVSVGVGGYIFSNEFSFIKDVVSSKVDIDHWISFSGWNDVYSAYRGHDYLISPDMFNIEATIYLNPPNEKWPKTKSKWSPTNKPNYDDFNLKTLYLLKFLFFKILKTDISYNSTINLDDYKIKKNIQPMEYTSFWKIFSHEIILATKWSELNNIKFTYILQPDLYSSKKSFHENELKIYEDNKSLYPNLVKFYQEYYSRLRTDLFELSKKYNFEFIDMEKEIIGKNKDFQFFVDHVHIGSKGNKLIGEYLNNNL